MTFFSNLWYSNFKALFKFHKNKIKDHWVYKKGDYIKLTINIFFASESKSLSMTHSKYVLLNFKQFIAVNVKNPSKLRQGGNNGLFITLFKKFLKNVFLFVCLTTFFEFWLVIFNVECLKLSTTNDNLHIR